MCKWGKLVINIEYSLICVCLLFWFCRVSEYVCFVVYIFLVVLFNCFGIVIVYCVFVFVDDLKFE